ncbi:MULTISPECIES: MFS transporter [unclassified Rhodococcus (in: high G+C Gram-positive bacteria)]|uniref:MFS transporter n=1 Tax=unclassified Rhodococcus (in: high G+C Gram-positive bacteria) TaxID=192944 RepID=UPI000BC54C18|nr:MULTISPECIES: MFS transporter [unclassified Rhodococcus (in: high G+C Gram-positive bacteria)]MBP1160088.1 MFS family permease [Rhodococcus sp. PvR099]PTR41305.1 putative MFS family arabinose efflux permease [Rhodococcus sp. OK611]SNX92127.1 Predicted arabinose efflux permease, MFS family [Rhodococcus sp. OK270]
MGIGRYAALLARRPVRRLILVGMIARLPHSAAGLILTLHVVQTLGRGYAAAGLAAAALTIGIAVGSPWRGRLIDRIGLRRTLLPSVIAEGVLWPIVAFVPYQALIPVAFVCGAFALPIFTVVRQSISVLVGEADRRTAYALDSIGTELVFIVGPATGVFLGTHFSTRYTLIAIGVSVVVAGLFLMWFNPPTRSETPAVAAGAEAAVAPAVDDATAATLSAATRPGWLTAAAVGVFAASAGATLILAGTDVGILAALRASGEVQSLGVVFFFWCVSSIVGGLIYGAMHRPVSPALLLFLLGLFTLPMAFATSTFTLAALAIPAGLFCAPVMAATGEAIADLVPEDRRGEAMGWQGTSFTLGGAVGSPLAGAMVDRAGPAAGFTAVAVVGMAIGLAGYVAKLWVAAARAGRHDHV